MAMSFPLPTFTVDMVRAFPDDGQRYELVEGVLLVTPASGSDHQIVIARLLAALHTYLGDRGPAYVVSPGEIEIAPTLHLEPDLGHICILASPRCGSWTWIGAAARSLAWADDVRSLSTGRCVGTLQA